jgi:dUTP pyrophosphatase
MRKQVKISVQKISDDIKLPQYAKFGDSGMDVCAAKDIIIKPGETVIVPTGLKVAIPDGYELQVRPRSGLSFNTPLRVSNSPGTIDSSYRDELGIIITNTSDIGFVMFDYTVSEKGNRYGNYNIKKGDRIAQLVLQEVPEIIWDEVDDVSIIGFNRNGGFGSTGVS